LAAAFFTAFGAACDFDFVFIFVTVDL
jgi:hypothetical protein